MSEPLKQVDNALSAYRHALDLKNGRSVLAQLTYIEKNCIPWLSKLSAECRAQREFGLAADTAAALAATNIAESMKLVYVMQGEISLAEILKIPVKRLDGHD